MNAHKGERRTPWSERHLGTAKEKNIVFCQAHPEVQLRKRNWRGKEKVLLPTCPKCEAEALVRREQGQIGNISRSCANLGSSGPSFLRPSAARGVIRGSSASRGQLGRNRYAMMMNSSSASSRPGYNQSCSAFDEHNTSGVGSSSSRTGLGNISIPDSPLDVSPLDVFKVNGMSLRQLDVRPPDPEGRRSPRVPGSCRNLSLPPLIEENSAPRLGSLEYPNGERLQPRQQRKAKDPPSSNNEPPLVLTKRDTLPTGLKKDGSKNHPKNIDTIQEEADSISSLENSTASGDKNTLNNQKSVVTSTVVNATKPVVVNVTLTDKATTTSPNVPDSKISPSRRFRSRSPKRNLKVRSDKKVQKPVFTEKMPDPMDFAKEQERLHRKVGAVSMGGGSSLQDMKVFANYGTESIPDLMQNISTSTPAVLSEIQKNLNDLKVASQDDPGKAKDLLHELQSHCQESEENQEEAVAAGAIKTVVATSERFPSVAGVQDEVCWVLGTLAADNNHKSAIAEQGGIRQIILSMYLLEDDYELQATGLEVMNHLVDDHMLNKIAFCEYGGIPPIITAMNKYCTSQKILGLAILLLANIASDCEVAKIMITEAGGIAAVFSAMMTQKGSAEIQECGCGFIANISCSNETAKFLISQSGGIGFIVTAMKNHGEDAGVQEHALYALQNLAYNCDDTKNMVIEYGAILPILAVTKNHRSEEAVIRAACDTLVMLIHLRDCAKGAAFDSGAVNDTLSLLEDASMTAAVHRSACQVLMNLAHNHMENKERIAAVGGFPIILACLLNRPMDAPLLEEGLKCLTSLTVKDQNKVIMNGACGVDVVVSAMKNHPLHVGIQEAAVRTFVNLCCCAKLHESITECGGVDAILEAMENHLDSTIIQEKSCICLLELADSDFSKRVIVEAGGLDLLLTALKFNKNHSGISRVASRALEILTAGEEDVRLEIAESLGFESFEAAVQKSLAKLELVDDDSGRSRESGSSTEFASG